MLPRIRVLQIGDVHLPTAAKESRNVDQKDASFSVELRNIISSTPTKVVFKQIYKLLEDGSIDVVLFMGDLTDIGHLENYDRSCAFIANALQLGNSRVHASMPLGIVPGNHDINRDLAKDPGLSTKFHPLNEALYHYGLPALPVEHNISQIIRKDAASIDLNLMNSCWGCGSTEYIPEAFRDRVGRAIEEVIEDGDERVLSTYYDRQFDTPAFSNPSIEDLIQRSTSCDPNSLLVAVAHHNLLPQRLPRLAPYTELVNSGALRASLMEAGRPSLYLHGHIHEDPIEILMNESGHHLICVSAPAARDGFNVIDLVFTQTGIPLAAVVNAWRFDRSGILRRRQRHSLPLIGRRRRSHNRGLSKLYSYLLDQGECYWSDLVGHTPTFFSDNNEGAVLESIEMLMVDSSVIVENYEMDPANWIIRANI